MNQTSFQPGETTTLSQLMANSRKKEKHNLIDGDLTLSDLPFRDLYLNPAIDPIFNVRGREAVEEYGLTARVPQQFNRLCSQLLEIGAAVNKDDFSLDMGNSYLRGRRLFNVDGELELCFRYVPPEIPQLDTLNYSATTLATCKAWYDTPGLYFIVGETGNGKTTLIMSLIQWWQENRGGIYVTAEDPVEFRLKKISEPNSKFTFKTIQCEVDSSDLFPYYINASLREAPTLLLVGELRTPEAVEAAINAGLSGFVVVCTTHGNCISAGLTRVTQQALASNLGDSAPMTLSQAMKGTVHQIIDRKQGKPINKILDATGEDATQIATALRNNDPAALEGIVDTQGKRREYAKSEGRSPTTKPHSGTELRL